MSIPINDIVPRIQYTAAGGQTVFNYPFPIFANTDLAVYQTLAGATASDANDILTLNVDYTVTGVGNQNGGTIVLTVATAVNDIITIVRDMPEDRMNLYINGGLFTATMVNDDFSRDVMMNQQNEMRNSQLNPHYNTSAQVRGPQYAPPDTNVDLLLPLLPANCVWRMNAGRTAIEPALFGGGGSAVVILPTVANHIATFTDTIGTLHDSGVDISAITSGKVNVAQAAHGFVVGNVVYLNGAVYTLAIASAAATSEVIGIVSAVTDANNFVLQINGQVTSLAGLVAGDVQFLSPTVAGALTSTKPTNPGHVIKPVLIAQSATTGVWTNQLGVII